MELLKDKRITSLTAKNGRLILIFSIISLSIGACGIPGLSVMDRSNPFDPILTPFVVGMYEASSYTEGSPIKLENRQQISSLDEALLVVFSAAMDQDTVTDELILQDPENDTVHPINLQFDWPELHQLRISPPGAGWPQDATIRIIIPETARNIGENPLDAPFTSSFTTAE
ncbi:Ig-like domain-containing protein [Spirochaeta dissipatitropha]